MPINNPGRRFWSDDRPHGSNLPWHYKIFCVNGKYGIQIGFRIFLFIHLPNEEDYERKESSIARINPIKAREKSKWLPAVRQEEPNKSAVRNTSVCHRCPLRLYSSVSSPCLRRSSCSHCRCCRNRRRLSGRYVAVWWVRLSLPAETLPPAVYVPLKNSETVAPCPPLLVCEVPVKRDIMLPRKNFCGGRASLNQNDFGWYYILNQGRHCRGYSVKNVSIMIWPNENRNGISDVELKKILILFCQ